MKKILLGLSGGIDSEYSAKLLKQQGFEVHGVYVDMLGKSVEAVQNKSKELDIPLYIVDKKDSFQNHVLTPFCQYYKEGKTPNPCVECNKNVKIQSLFEESERLDIPYIATGHYANICNKNGRYAISKAVDEKKDQSYFLWKLNQSQISKLVFPLGNVIKKDLLYTSEKGYKESQDICFVQGDYRDLLTYLGVNTPKGNFVTIDGKAVGTHLGIQNYTRGQRKGLGIALGYPAYVVNIDSENNTVTLGSREKLEIRSFRVKDINFQSAEPFDDVRIYDVKTRYRAKPAKVSVKINGDIGYCELFEADTLVTPGQSAVFYDGESIAFGGEIIGEGMK